MVLCTSMSDDRECSTSDRDVLHGRRTFQHVQQIRKHNTPRPATFLVTNHGLRMVTFSLVSHSCVSVMTLYRNTLLATLDVSEHSTPQRVSCTYTREATL